MPLYCGRVVAGGEHRAGQVQVAGGEVEHGRWRPGRPRRRRRRGRRRRGERAAPGRGGGAHVVADRRSRAAPVTSDECGAERVGDRLVELVGDDAADVVRLDDLRQVGARAAATGDVAQLWRGVAVGKRGGVTRTSASSEARRPRAGVISRRSGRGAGGPSGRDAPLPVGLPGRAATRGCMRSECPSPWLPARSRPAAAREQAPKQRARGERGLAGGLGGPPRRGRRSAGAGRGSRGPGGGRPRARRWRGPRGRRRCGGAGPVSDGEPDDLPAARRGQPLGVLGAQVVAVRLGVGGERVRGRRWSRA